MLPLSPFHGSPAMLCERRSVVISPPSSEDLTTVSFDIICVQNPKVIYRCDTFRHRLRSNFERGACFVGLIKSVGVFRDGPCGNVTRRKQILLGSPVPIKTLDVKTSRKYLHPLLSVHVSEGRARIMFFVEQLCFKFERSTC